jgi:hypothetical protein
MFQDQIQEHLHKKKLNGISAKKLSKKIGQSAKSPDSVEKKLL